MQRANGRQKQNAYRFKPRQRDAPLPHPQEDKPSSSSGLNPPLNDNLSEATAAGACGVKKDDVGTSTSTSETVQKQGNCSKDDRKGTLDVKLKKSQEEEHENSKSWRTVDPKTPTAWISRQNGNNLPFISGAAKSQGSASSSRSTSVNPSELSKAENTTGIDGDWRVQKSRYKRKEILSEPAKTSSNVLTHNSIKTSAATTTVSQQKQQGTPRSGAAEREGGVPEENKNDLNKLPANAKKKKKRPIGSKEERQKKRDAAALNELYKPKDSHVNVLTPEMFQKLKGGTTVPSPAISSPFVTPGSIRASNTNLYTSTPIPHSASVSEFPVLSSSSSSASSMKTPQFKSFSAASAVPQVPVLPSANFKENEGGPDSGHFSANIALITPSPTTLPTISDIGKKTRLSERPITFNISDALSSPPPPKLKNAVANKQIAKKSKHDKLSAIRENPKLTVGNFLDSSGPVVIHRGKIKQKKKKPTKLKKSILLTRELRKSLNDFPLTVNAVIESEKIKSSTSVDSNGGEKDLEKSLKCNESVNVQDLTTLLVPNDSNENGDDDETLPLFVNSPKEEGERNPFKALLEEAEENSKMAPTVPNSVIELVKLQMHTRKFRSYCDMYVSKELHGLVIPLMTELHRLQDRIYKTDPIKLQAKRRYVNGIKEVTNSLKLKKVQLVILAPDIEPGTGNDGLDCKITEIISLAKEKKVPFIFSGNRFILGKCIKQTKSPVSAIAILDKQSVEEQFNKVLELAESQRDQYKTEFDRRVQEIMANGA